MNTPPHILVVDDDTNVRFVLQEALRSEGYHIVAVESGEAALEEAARQTFDLVLLDLLMPGINGIETLKRLRPRAPGAVFIVLTAHASLETAVEALRQGAHDYLFKPCDPATLRESVRAGLLKRQQEHERQSMFQQLEQKLAHSLAEIRAVVAGAAAPPPLLTSTEPSPAGGRFLRRGGLIVDFMRHIVTLDGKLLELSPTEFALLAYLVSESPRVIPPQELVQEIQGYDVEPWEASDLVRHHIYRLREKIRAAAGRTDVVRTRRGVGYFIGE